MGKLKLKLLSARSRPATDAAGSGKELTSGAKHWGG